MTADRRAAVDKLLEERTRIVEAGGNPARLAEVDRKLARFAARPTRARGDRPETRGD